MQAQFGTKALSGAEGTAPGSDRECYMGTSLIRTPPPVGPYGDLRGVGVSYERGNPVAHLDGEGLAGVGRPVREEQPRMS